jgi:hypothetical protein
VSGHLSSRDDLLAKAIATIADRHLLCLALMSVIRVTVGSCRFLAPMAQ